MASTLALLALLQLALFSSVSCIKVCGRPPITDGIDELALKRVYEPGEAVTLSCEQGYTPSTLNPRRITCTATGEWTQSDLACSPKMCPIPRPLQPLAMGRTEAPYKSVLNFTCVMTGNLAFYAICSCLSQQTTSMDCSSAVNCLCLNHNGWQIVYNKAITGNTVQYGHSWTYECNPPKAPSHERGLYG
ncbi:hypothetical protein fugu_007879 [Takifugu bimaculatus]|uniref:Sushi domain-containing protein n=1 Tax=Takifugu bimaculatus TaxID=433685 RepID=A0A4Z2B219_9TELE|nr:hypothetical protein fugu_007879 [Takifugu bimaculatus]